MFFKQQKNTPNPTKAEFFNSLFSKQCYVINNIGALSLHICSPQTSGECRQTFRWMLLNIPGNIAKLSGGNVTKYSGKMSSNILGNAAKDSGECRQTFRGMLPNISGIVAKHSGECRQFWCKWRELLGRVKFRNCQTSTMELFGENIQWS